jgi:hypothetical protein
VELIVVTIIVRNGNIFDMKETVFNEYSEVFVRFLCITEAEKGDIFKCVLS